MSESRLVQAEALRSFTAEVVRAMGAGPETADEVARHLVSANLCGHDSHGVLRLSQYVEEADRGDLVPAAEPELLRESAVCALLDARRGFGHRSTMVAADWVARHAREHGLAAAAVRHSTHIGRLGGENASVAGGARGWGWAGGWGGTVAPFGGAARFLGTNPWSIGVPAGGRPPLIFDAATSTIAEGKARLARARRAQGPGGRGPGAVGG